jgi:hypothetical protein
MTVNLVAIADAISKVSISGVTVKDINEIPDQWDMRQPALFPRANDFITECSVEAVTNGGNSAAKDLTYTLNYVFMYAPVGSGRGLLDAYSGMVTMACTILDTFAATDFTAYGALRFEVSMGAFGPVADPSGAMGHGCEFAFKILEFI